MWFLWFAPTAQGGPGTMVEWRRDLEFSFNPNGFARGKLELPDGRSIVYTPRKWGRVGGVTLYVNQTDRDDLCAFFTKAGHSLWVPVTREQLLTAYIRSLEPREVQEAPEDDIRAKVAELDETEKRIRDADYPLPAEKKQEMLRAMEKAKVDILKMQEQEEKSKKEYGRDPVLDPLRSQLAHMSTAERASQAWVEAPNFRLVPAGTGEPMVSFDPNYYDRSRPRSDIQAIMVDFTFGGDELADIPPPFRDPSQISRHAMWEFARQVDWQAVAAMVH